jgi:hypothetical protein
LKDPKSVGFHARKDSFINCVHESGRFKGVRVVRGESAAGFHKKRASPRRFEVHESAEIFPWISSQETGLADCELSKIFEWKIDASSGGVFGHVAENVGHLQRIAEELGVDFASGILAAEDFDADESDRTRHAPAIGAQLLMGLITDRLDVHFDPEYDLNEKVSVDFMACEDVGQRRRKLVAGVESSFPEIEQFMLLDWRTSRFVSDIVDGAAEVIEYKGVHPAVWREASEGKGEIGFPCVRPGGKLQSMDIHRRLSELMRPSCI